MRRHPTTCAFAAPFGIFLRIAALVTAATLAVAAHAQSDPSGTISGRVFSASAGRFLPNARVQVVGSTIETLTTEAGEYTLRNVPAGDATVKVSFSGQADLTKTVTVQAGGTAQQDFAFGAAGAKPDEKTDVYLLDPYKVETERFRNAQQIATNEERAAVNIKSVVALDSLGYIPDGNIGEFARFLPGVDVINGSSSGNTNNPDNAMTIGVRGFDADSTTILIDGVPVASGSTASDGSLTRAVMLDSLSINNASRLEIIKVATPDMPQNSPGGTINLITRGAFELARPTYDVSVAFNGNTNTPDVFKKTPGPYEPSFKTLPSVRVSGAIPLSKKLGVSFSIASDNKYSLTRNSNMRDWFYAPRTVTINGVVTPVTNAQGAINLRNPVIDRMELVDNQWLDQRVSGSVRLDWRPVDGLEVRLSGQYSTLENTGVYRRTQWRYSNAAGILNWGEDFVTGRQRTATFNPSYSVGMTTDSRDKEGFTSQGYLSAVYKKGPWAINAKASASESFNDLPDRKNGHFSTVDASLAAGRMDFTGVSKGVIGAINVYDINGSPVDYGALSAWNPLLTTGYMARSSQVRSRDLNKQYNLDISRELDFLPFPMTVKVGAQQTEKGIHKWGAGTGYRTAYTGPSAGVPTNAQLQSDFATEALYGYATPQYWADPKKIYEFYTSNTAQWTDTWIDPVSNNNLPANNYLSRVGTTKGLTITNTDWYAMATAQLFRNRLTLIGGFRQSSSGTVGFNVYNDPKYQFVRLPDGTLYRDSVYTGGVRFDGANNYGSRPRDAILTDSALRARMAAAGVVDIPTHLELAPNGIANGTSSNNLVLAQRARYTRFIDTSLTQPKTPQVQAAFDITDDIRVQLAWSKETRLPNLEGSNGILVGGSSFQVSELDVPTGDIGGDGTITVSNLLGKPEINQSYNAKLSWYPQRGGGRYSISYYYKVVDNAWQTVDTFNTDQDYDNILTSMGFDPADFLNYRISTTTATGIKQVRKGFEVEAVQNLGVIGVWARGLDAFVTYTRRPVTASTGGEARLGWVSVLPVRAKWTGGLSYAGRRYSAQARFIFVESGITYNSNPTATLPDGTSQAVQLYNLNKDPMELNLQFNYVLNKRFTVFAVANRVLSSEVFSQVTDAVSGYIPSWAGYRSMQARGVALSVGTTAKF